MKELFVKDVPMKILYRYALSRIISFWTLNFSQVYILNEQDCDTVVPITGVHFGQFPRGGGGEEKVKLKEKYCKNITSATCEAIIII